MGPFNTNDGNVALMELAKNVWYGCGALAFNFSHGDYEEHRATLEL